MGMTKELPIKQESGLDTNALDSMLTAMSPEELKYVCDKAESLLNEQTPPDFRMDDEADMEEFDGGNQGYSK